MLIEEWKTLRVKTYFLTCQDSNHGPPKYQDGQSTNVPSHLQIFFCGKHVYIVLGNFLILTNERRLFGIPQASYPRQKFSPKIQKFKTSKYLGIDKLWIQQPLDWKSPRFSAKQGKYKINLLKFWMFEVLGKNFALESSPQGEKI